MTTHVKVSKVTLDALKKVKEDSGLRSIDAVVQRLLNPPSESDVSDLSGSSEEGGGEAVLRALIPRGGTWGR